MKPELYICGVIMTVLFLSLLAWKWKVKIKIAAISGIFIGFLAALFTNLIYASMEKLEVYWWVITELIFIGIITSLIIALRFYRNPERYPEETKNVILAPADGTVVYVQAIEKGSALVSTKGDRKFKLDEILATDLTNDATYLIGIDMNVLNIHVNRSPIAGNVMLLKRTEGRFISLRKQDSEIINERVTTVIDNGSFKVAVVQIASRLVRRIVTYIKEGNTLEIGQRIGAIVFGSQVDAAIPRLENLRIEVKPGDEVQAGISVLARYD